MHAWGLVRAAPAPVRLNLASMVLFNVGFYMVVPFLAVHLAQDLGLAAWLIGLVLGVRIVTQQGLFFFGGLLADRLGNRTVILVGIALRVVGFLVLGLARTVPTLLAGVVMVGVAAALFAPAVESSNAAYGRLLEDEGVMLRTELFGLEQMSSRVGTVLGPAVGALLLPVPFLWTTGVAAGLFAGLWVAFARQLAPDRPVRSTGAAADAGVPAWRAVLSNRTFLGFAALCSVQLLAQNLIYLMLPQELARASAEHLVGWFYVGAAVLVVLGQSRSVRLVHRLGHRRAVVVGGALLSLAFLAPGLVAATDAAGDVLLIGALVVWLALLQVAQMVMVPPLRDTVAVLAGERHLAAHFGMLNTVGGAAALSTSLLVGWLYDASAEQGAGMATLPWLVVAVGIAAVTVALLAWRSWATPARRPASG